MISSISLTLSWDATVGLNSWTILYFSSMKLVQDFSIFLFWISFMLLENSRLVVLHWIDFFLVYESLWSLEITKDLSSECCMALRCTPSLFEGSKLRRRARCEGSGSIFVYLLRRMKKASQAVLRRGPPRLSCLRLRCTRHAISRSGGSDWMLAVAEQSSIYRSSAKN